MPFKALAEIAEMRAAGGAGSGNFGHGGRPGEVGGSSQAAAEKEAKAASATAHEWSADAKASGDMNDHFSAANSHEYAAEAIIKAAYQEHVAAGKEIGKEPLSHSAFRDRYLKNSDNKKAIEHLRLSKEHRDTSYKIAKDLGWNDRTREQAHQSYMITRRHYAGDLRTLSFTASSDAKPYWSELDGKRHLVVPVVALMGNIVVRPMNSEVPEFVPADALERNAAEWDGSPILWHHPEEGRALARGNEDILSRYAFGQMRATCYKNGALQSEAWLDPEAAKRIGQEAVDRVKRCADGEGLADVSIGALIEFETLAGTHEGKPYGIRWKSVKPDHLAILPSGLPGACSVAAGCGAPRVMAEKIEAAGGPGSGNFGHGGRPGEVGGSAEGSGEVKITPPATGKSVAAMNAIKTAIEKGSPPSKRFNKEGGGEQAKALYNNIKTHLESSGFKGEPHGRYQAYQRGSQDFAEKFSHPEHNGQFVLSRNYFGVVPGDYARGYRGSHSVRLQFSRKGSFYAEGTKMPKLDHVLRALGLKGDSPEPNEKLATALLANDEHYNGTVEQTDTHVVYMSGDKLMQQEYKAKDEGFELLADPVEVEPVTRYEPLAGPNEDEDDVNLEQVINFLAGKRHSASDEQMIQTVHDHAVALGAACEKATGMSTGHSEMQKHKGFKTLAEIKAAGGPGSGNFGHGGRPGEVGGSAEGSGDPHSKEYQDKQYGPEGSGTGSLGHIVSGQAHYASKFAKATAATNATRAMKSQYHRFAANAHHAAATYHRTIGNKHAAEMHSTAAKSHERSATRFGSLPSVKMQPGTTWKRV